MEKAVERREEEETTFGDTSEEEEDESTISALTKLLQRLPVTSTTSVGGAAPDLPTDPGLVVKGRVISRLPLTSADASFLSAHGRVSAHGRGMDTVVDTRVRSSKEFNPNTDYCFTNPAWRTGVEALARNVATKLGLERTCQVEARPYKLLLYSQRDHFLPHRDTEKEKGMFATLIIQLPSSFTGGALVLFHPSSGKTRRKETIRYDIGASLGQAALQCHYVAHYADVEHEVEPITAGHRLVVVYNLVWNVSSTQPLPPPLTGSDALVMEISEALKEWKDVPRGMVVMLLEHLYTEEALDGCGILALKGKDRVLGSFVCAANALLDAQHRVSLYVVTVDYTKHYDNSYGTDHSFPSLSSYGRSKRGDYDEDGDDEEEDYDEEEHGDYDDASDISEHIHWYSVIGLPAKFADLVINWQTDVAAAEGLAEKRLFCFKGDSYKQEYTGNEGPSRRTTYHRSALVMWPEATEIDLRMTNSGLYSAVVCAHASKSNEEELLRKVDQVLDLWSDLSNSEQHPVGRTSCSAQSIAKGVSLLLQCLPGGDCARLQRVLELVLHTQPSKLCSSYLPEDLEDLGKQIAHSISDDRCASSESLVQTVTEVVAAWVLEKGLKSMPAVQAILEAVVKTNATPSRALQLLAAITQALTEREALADHSSSFGNAHFESTWRQANTGTTCLFFLHQPLHLMAEKWEWSDIEHHVMALLHATNFITLPHRLAMATHLLSSAPLAARAIAHDTIGAILNTTKDFSSELETLLIPALAFCASVDDVERAHEVCNAIVRAVGVEEANRYLNDELGGWPAFQKKLFLLLAEPCIKELEMLVGNGPPAFSWEQPHAQLCREPYHFAKESEEEQQLLSFLRSTQQSTIIDGFHSYSSARSFAATHAKGAPSTHAYSATFAAKARYGDYCVVVVKTKEMYKQERSAYKKRCAELAALRARLAATDDAKTDQ